MTRNNRRGPPKNKRQIWMLPLFIQIALIAGSWSYCEGQNLTSAPTDTPNVGSAAPVSVAPSTGAPSTTPIRTSGRPSLAPSLRPSVSASPSSRQSEVPSLRPSVSLTPSISPIPSTQPSSLPSYSAAPSESFTPSISLIPSTQPSFPPSDAPSTAPSDSFEPSLSPSLLPSPSPTNRPSPPPSQAPSDTPSIVPTQSPAPSSYPSDAPTSPPTKSLSPSAAPSISFQPSDSLVPSMLPSNGPTITPRPTDAPTESPSERPSVVPSVIPSSVPSSEPTVTLTTVTQPFLTMTLEGLTVDLSANDIVNWEIVTSDHVHDFWNELPFSPLFVGKVVTKFISQDRIIPDPAPRDNSTEIVTPSALAPLEILYEQTASFGALVDEWDTNLSPVEEAVFLEPFRQNSLPYVRQIITLTGNQGPVFLTNIEIQLPQPSSAPTSAPVVAVGGRNDERRIILTVVFCVGSSVVIAFAYIVYLTRKENYDGPIVGPLPSDEFGSEDDIDMFYRNNAMQSPSSTQVVAHIAQSQSFESDIDSPRSVYSDTRSQDRSLEGSDAIRDSGRLRRERSSDSRPMQRERSSGSFPQSPLPVIDDPEAIAVHHVSSGSVGTSGDNTDLPHSPSGDSTLSPSMDGFNLKIEDIED